MDNIRKILKEELENHLNEVRYLNTKYPQVKNEDPLSDNQVIRVFHGFYSFKDVEEVLKKGLSGKERAKRIYSYESGNNPNGLFVSVNFDVVAKNFASSGVIIEFSSKVSDLEAPVWVDGRSYYTQGEFTKSFKGGDDRENQRLVNREKEKNNELEPIAKSDRPELAATLFDNPEKQALYIGDLDPNMIKNVWYNEVRHKERRTNGPWTKMSRKDFILKMGIDTKKGRFMNYPNDDFDFDALVQKYYKGNYEHSSLLHLLYYFMSPNNDYELKNMGYYPKQIEQIKQLNAQGYFDKYKEKLSAVGLAESDGFEIEEDVVKYHKAAYGKDRPVNYYDKSFKDNEQKISLKNYLQANGNQLKSGVTLFHPNFGEVKFTKPQGRRMFFITQDGEEQSSLLDNLFIIP